MSDVYFTSDLHFGHKRMLEFRPFDSVEAMDGALIERWNSRVTNGDRIYIIGDLSFHRADRTAEIIDQLNGQKHLVEGNHDKLLRKLADKFESYQPYKELRVGDQRLVLFHYALRTWNQAHFGAWHLYGHSHGNLADDPNALSMDVGVDTNDLYPYSYWDVMDHMAKKVFKPVDHHGA